MYEFEYTDDFAKALKKLELSVQTNIKQKIQFLIEQENPLYFAKKIRGYKFMYRFRVGDYRLLFRLEKKVIRLFDVAHRKEIYEDL